MQIQSIYDRYVSALRPVEGYEGDNLYLIFESGNILVNVYEDRISIPYCKNLEALDINPISSKYMGTYNDQPCYAVQVEAMDVTPAGMEFKALRSLFGIIENELFLLAGRASHILYWYRTHRFCGRCGVEMKEKDDERAMICTECGLISYPRISPAIIVAVVKDKKILLARAKHFTRNMYSVIAGFVEPGETFEDCVVREVMEEVGIKVKSLKYFGSQPWPFPDSLMVGFTAEYESGEITVDGIEIGDAGWYGKDELPNVPTKMSISGRLISWFVENS